MLKKDVSSELSKIFVKDTVYDCMNNIVPVIDFFRKKEIGSMSCKFNLLPISFLLFFLIII